MILVYSVFILHFAYAFFGSIAVYLTTKLTLRLSGNQALGFRLSVAEKASYYLFKQSASTRTISTDYLLSGKHGVFKSS